jgi:hypothetical protein
MNVNRLLAGKTSLSYTSRLPGPSAFLTRAGFVFTGFNVAFGEGLNENTSADFLIGGVATKLPVVGGVYWFANTSVNMKTGHTIPEHATTNATAVDERVRGRSAASGYQQAGHMVFLHGRRVR